MCMVLRTQCCGHLFDELKNIFFNSTNQKQELPMAAILFSGLRQNEEVKIIWICIIWDLFNFLPVRNKNCQWLSFLPEQVKKIWGIYVEDLTKIICTNAQIMWGCIFRVDFIQSETGITKWRSCFSPDPYEIRIFYLDPQKLYLYQLINHWREENI